MTYDKAEAERLIARAREPRIEIGADALGAVWLVRPLADQLEEAQLLIHQRMEAKFLLNSAQQRIAELEERHRKHLELIRRISQETPLPAEAEGWTSQRSALVAEVGTLKARVESLHRELDSGNEAFRVVRERWIAERADRQQVTDLALAERDTLLAILRAIWPVWLTVSAWAKESELVKAGISGVGSIERCFQLEEQTEKAIITARAALTPELLAAARAAGLEVP